MLYLHQNSLSPDPLYEKSGTLIDGFYSGMKIYPNSLESFVCINGNVEDWGKSLDLFNYPGQLETYTNERCYAEFIIDFGTELAGELELDCTVDCCSNVYVAFGESVFEAELRGAPGTVPPPVEIWHIDKGGRHKNVFPSRGFRFIKISVHDTKKIVFHSILVHALFAFHKGRLGDFNCSDERFQRVWQTSVYTARLCSRMDEYWDGVKRDRHGWYGDARITQQTTDNIFFDKRPAIAMLLKLQTDVWANYTPTYSFDAIAMLKQVIMVYGLEDPNLNTTYKKIREMLAWCKRTQTMENGLFTRDKNVRYDYGVGFIDWSPMPLGGRFEEISWVQMKYLEGLRNATFLARTFGEKEDEISYSNDANKLEKQIKKLFWRPETGFVHTLNKVIEDSKMSWEVDHFSKTFIENIRLGESGPSRHSNALAVWSGVCKEGSKDKVLDVLNDNNITQIITGYFAFYEQSARAQCGDRLGAIMNMRNYIGQQLEGNDSATIWESYEPQVKDFRKWGLHSFPKSLCHGWSSGTVPITTKYLLGISPENIGFQEISINPETSIPWTFNATIPTPHGNIGVIKKTEYGNIEYSVPSKIKVVGQLKDSVKITNF